MERLSLLSLWTASFLLLAVSPQIVLDARAGAKDSEKCDFREVGLKAGGTSEPEVRLKQSSGGANRRAASIAVQDENDLPGETNTQGFRGRLRDAENSSDCAQLGDSRVGKQKAPMPAGKMQSGQSEGTHDTGEGHGGRDRHLRIPRTSIVSESYPLDEVIVTDPVSRLQVEPPRFDVKMQSGKDRNGQGARAHDAGEAHGGRDRHLRIPRASIVSESYPLDEVIVTDPVSRRQVEPPRFDVKMQSGEDRSEVGSRFQEVGHGFRDSHLRIPRTSIVSESYPLNEVIVTDPVSVPQVAATRDIFDRTEEGGVSGDGSAESSGSRCCSGSRIPDSVTFTKETEPARESSRKPAETAGRNSLPATFRPDNFAIMIEDGLPSVLDLLSDMLSKAEEGRLPRDESKTTPSNSTPLADSVVMLNEMETTGTPDDSVLKLRRTEEGHAYSEDSRGIPSELLPPMSKMTVVTW